MSRDRDPTDGERIAGALEDVVDSFRALNGLLVDLGPTLRELVRLLTPVVDNVEVAAIIPAIPADGDPSGNVDDDESGGDW